MTRHDQFRVFAIFVQHANMDKLTEKGEQYVKRFEDAAAGLMPFDLGVGSAELLAVLTQIGDEFGTTIPPEEAHKWKSMQDLFDYLDR